MKNLFKSKKFLILLCVMLCIAVCGIVALYTSSHISIGGTFYPRDITQLDLSGVKNPELDRIVSLTELTSLDLQDTELSVEDFVYLQTSLPRCAIRWSVPFQGGYCDSETESLTVSSLSEEDLSALAYFPRLTAVNADACRNYEQLLALRQAYPEISLTYVIELGGSTVSPDVSSLTLDSITAAELERFLPHFTNLTTLTLKDCQDPDSLLTLRQERPDLTVTYPVTLGNTVVSSDTTQITLESVEISDLTAALPHLTSLTNLTITGAGADSHGLLDLMQMYPLLTISWDMDICGVTVSSLAEEVDISDHKVEDLAALENLVSRMPNVQKVIMSNCGISNADMEALNNRHEDILFVWTVKIAGFSVRTDVTEMMPWKYDHELLLSTEQGYNLRYLTELVCLDLGHHRMTNCDFVAYMPKLKYLLLGDVPISDLTPLTGLQNLVYLELFLTKATDYTPLLTLTNLEDLNISFTHGQVDVISQLTWVDYIRWVKGKNSMLSEDDQAYLRQCLPDTILELGHDTSATGGQWRNTQNYYDMRDYLGMVYMTG